MAVLVHGSGALNRDEVVMANAPFRDLAHGLAERGVASLRFDKRTLVYPNKQLTIEEETIDDALSAVALAQSLSPDVFLVGHSLGGMLAPLIASKSPQLRGIVLMAAPARPMSVVVKEQIDYLTLSGTSQSVKDSLYHNMTLRSPQYFSGTMATYDQLATAQALVMPVLVLQGERDYQVRMSDFNLWKSALSHKAGATFKSYPKLHHLFVDGGGDGALATPMEYEQQGHIPPEVLDDMADFMRSQGR